MDMPWWQRVKGDKRREKHDVATIQWWVMGVDVLGVYQSERRMRNGNANRNRNGNGVFPLQDASTVPISRAQRNADVQQNPAWRLTLAIK
jgi:hypothetical protein